MQPIGWRAAEAAAAEVGRFQHGRREQIGLLVEPVLENLLDRARGRRAEVQRQAKGGVEPTAAVLVAKTQQSLHRAQVIQHAVRQQALNHGQASWPGRLGLGQAPLRIAHEVRLGIGRQVIIDGGSVAPLEQARMHCDQFVFKINAHGVRGDLQPKRLVNQAKRRRVEAVVMLDMAIRMQLGLRPGGAGRRDGRQRLQQGLFGFSKAFEGLLTRAAVDAVAGLAQHPRPQLCVGLRHAVEFTQRCEVALDVFDAGFDATLLRRIGDRTGIDDEAVAERQFAIELCTVGS